MRCLRLKWQINIILIEILPFILGRKLLNRVDLPVLFLLNIPKEHPLIIFWRVSGFKKYELFDWLLEGVVGLLLFLEKEVSLFNNGEALVVKLFVVQGFWDDRDCVKQGAFGVVVKMIRGKMGLR